MPWDATPRLFLFPYATAVNQHGHLLIGGCDTVELAREFGTPLYIFDEATLRSRCQEFQREFSQRYPQTLVLYACKAYINPALALIFRSEGLGLDVVSAGEISIARSVSFPLGKVYFHGSNKEEKEIRLALEWGVGRLVVDNLLELSLVHKLAQERGKKQDILLRISPGVDPHTHAHTTTGIVDSKFGFTVVTGQAEQALSQAMASPYLNLRGLHFHLGSPVKEVEPYQEAIRVALEFAAVMTKKYGFKMEEFSPGGGFAIPYVVEDSILPLARYAEAITAEVLSSCQRLSIQPPLLIVEPGRAIVGPAGVALYRVGAVKDIPGIRKYVSVDGGMADNIRPILYGAKYEALLANRVGDAKGERVRIAGRFCESGDVLFPDIDLPPLCQGDLIAVPAAGAYCLSMASNYNACLRPAILLVKGGKARLIRRRESYEDLIRCEMVPEDLT